MKNEAKVENHLTKIEPENDGADSTEYKLMFD